MMKWFFLAMVGLLVVSCLDEPDCLRLSDNALVISFLRLEDNEKDTVILYSISAESEGVFSDSVFYDYGNEPEADTLRGVSVIVSVKPYAASTRFTFEFPSSQKYLEVAYSTSVRFVSEDCGTETIISGLKIADTNFDSVRVASPVLTTKRPVNIEIFN